MSHRRAYWWVFALLLVAAWLRLADLGRLPDGLAPAEVTSAAAALTVRGGQVTVFLPTIYGQTQEFGYPILQAVMTSIFGDGLLWLRLLSAWAGLATVALTYTLGTRLYGRIAGLGAGGMMAVLYQAVFLSRLAIVESLLPLLVVALMLATARAMPVYRRERPIGTSIVAFAAFGVLFGLSFYLHPASLLLALALLGLVAYCVVTRRLSRQMLTYTGFALLIAIILAIPYLLSSIRQPELAAATRLLSNYGNGWEAVWQGLQGFIVRGSSDATFNAPALPYLPPLLAVFVFVGAALIISEWRRLRATLIVLVGCALLPYVLLEPNSPYFPAFGALAPLLALAFGVAFEGIRHVLLARWRWLVGLLLWLIVVGTALETAYQLRVWAARPDVQAIYRSDLAAIARHADATLGRIPSGLCYLDFAAIQNQQVSDTVLLSLMMNRSQLDWRIFDCRTALVFAEGGRLEQLIIPGQAALEAIPPLLRAWLERARVPHERAFPGRDVPPTVFVLEAQTLIADQLGKYTTTTPARYPIESAPTGSTLVPPPIRLGGNLTWLGYNYEANRSYQAGDTLDVANWWRVEGVLPTDVTLFTHLLADPVTIVAQRDFIGIAPATLRERDVFLHITPLQLPPTLLSGIYTVSIGAYTRSDEARLPVFDADQAVRGDRLILYDIALD